MEVAKGALNWKESAWTCIDNRGLEQVHGYTAGLTVVYYNYKSTCSGSYPYREYLH